MAEGLFLARIDTTFALYRQGAHFAREPAIRTGWPYLARHEPWYSDSANRSAEEINYAATLPPDRGNWGRDQLQDWMQQRCKKMSAGATPKLVHLACGRGAIPGWINLDADPDVSPDIVFDLEACAEQAMPIEAESVDGFFMCRSFERIGGKAAMMSELYRVAKPNARFVVRFRPSPASGQPDGSREDTPQGFARFAQPAQLAASRYLADWQLTRFKLILDAYLPVIEGEAEFPGNAHLDQTLLREVVVEMRAVKPARPRDPRLLELPEPVITRSAIDLETVF